MRVITLRSSSETKRNNCNKRKEMVPSPASGAEVHSRDFFWRAAPSWLALLGDLVKDKHLVPVCVALAEI